MGISDVLLFECDDRRCGLDASQVVEVVRAAAIEPLPKATDVVEGVLNVRGMVTPVLDLRSRLGLPPRAPHPNDHYIVARASERCLVVRTDRVTDFLQVKASEIRQKEDVVPGAEYISGIASLPDGLLLIYDLASFLTSAEAEVVAQAVREATQTETEAGDDDRHLPDQP